MVTQATAMDTMVCSTLHAAAREESIDKKI